MSQVVYSAFMYYATGGNDPYHMPLNSFTSFLDDSSIPDPESLSIKRSDCDTVRMAKEHVRQIVLDALSVMYLHQQ